MIISYLGDVSIYLKDNSLLISAPKSTVMLFTPDKHQFQTHPDITLEDAHLPLEHSPKILVVIMDPSLSFHKHCNYVSDRIDKRNNMLNALAGSSWGQEKETLLLTYNALGKSIASYAAPPVWSTNTSDSKKIQTAHNAALRMATGAHKMVSIDNLQLMLKVKDHSYMLSAQHLVNCLEEDNVCHGITTQEPRPRPMKESLHSRHHSRHNSTVLPRLTANRKESLWNLHTRGRFGYYAPGHQQSTEGAPTPNIG